MDLKTRHCVPCEIGVPKLESAQIYAMLGQLSGWSAKDDKLHKRYSFADFRAAMAFVNAMAELAEDEGHHPDFCVSYAQVDVTLWTHAIGGLSDNDFILAAKIDAL